MYKIVQGIMTGYGFYFSIGQVDGPKAYPRHSRTLARIMMRIHIILFILLATLLHVSATGYAQRITLSKQQIPLKQVFNEINQQTGFQYLWFAKKVKSSLRVDVNLNNVPLEEAIQQVLRELPLSYSLEDKTIIIKEKEKPDAFVQQELIVRGTVVDSLGNPLKGASVSLKGGNIRTVTNDRGAFTIVVPELERILVVSYLGMARQEVTVRDARAELRIILKADEVALDDVVVTGYGNIRKESFTGTYTQISKDQLLNVTATNLIGALQVFDPSFRIMVNNEMGSDPNTLPEFYIRGQSGYPGVKELDAIEGTTTSEFALRNNPNLPIFIMDGFEVSLERVYDLNINRIESLTILKDAAATAMYGSRASNGVIVIETIAPKPGEFRINYNGYYGMTMPDLSSYNMMNAREKLAAEVAAGLFIPDPNLDPSYSLGNPYALELMYLERRNAVNKGTDTYWLSQPLTTMFNHRHNLYVEGGSEALRLGIEMRYDNQNGVMKESSRERIGAGLTFQYQHKGIQVRNQTYFDVMSANDSPYGSFGDYSRLQPYFALYDETTGELRTRYTETGVVVNNPLYEATLGSFSGNGYKEWTNNLSANMALNPHLRIRADFAINYKDANSEAFTDPASMTYSTIADAFTKGYLSLSETKYFNWNTNLFASYNRLVSNSNINFAIGLNARATDNDYLASAYRGFPNASLYSPAYAYEIVTKPTLNDNKTRLLGGFSTLNYSLYDIYLLDASFRIDGSSEFGTARKWAPFWSAGTGINLHNTGFLKDQRDISLLRIRANVGETGKSNFAPYMARSTYQVLLDDWYPTGIGANIIYMGNDSLTWEKQISWNVGADIAIRNRHTLEVNYYHKTTYDLITDVSIPSSSGFTVYRDNIGKVLNKGFEIRGTYSAINTRDFNLVLTGNMAHNKNTILEIAESLKSYNDRVNDYYSGYSNNGEITGSAEWYSSDYQRNLVYARPIRKYEEGGSLTSIYGMQSLGINPANGREVFLKRDGTITQEWNAADQQVIGNTEPWAQGSFGINARYKQFSLYTTFLYEWGGDQYNSTLVTNVENVDLDLYNADRRVLSDRWQQPGDVTPLKNIADVYFVTRPTSRFVQRNNYVLFNSLSLGYDVAPALLQRMKMNTLRVSLLLNDIGRLSTIQRELGLSYPFARTYTFTFNATF